MKDAGYYSFNLAHAACYALIAYWLQWLKVHYPAEFVWALLVSEKDRANRARFVREGRRLGIEVRPPDVNTSMESFTLARESDGEGATRDVIVTGLTAIKGVGAGAVEALCRAQRPFTSFVDFHAGVDRRRCNRRVVETLARAGALRGIVPNQKWIVENCAMVWDSLQRNKRGQADELVKRSAETEDYDAATRARIVGDVCPIAIGQSPIGAFAELWDALGAPWVELGDEAFWERPSAMIRGQIVDITAFKDSRSGAGAQTFIVAIEDEHGSASFRLDGEAAALWQGSVYQGAMLMVQALVDAERQQLRPVAIASADAALGRLRTGERFEPWEAVFSRQQHPLRPFSRRNLDAAEEWMQAGTSLHALVGPVHMIQDRNRNDMAFVGLIGWEGARKAVAFASVFDRLREWLVPGRIARFEADPPRRGGDALVLTGKVGDPVPMRASTPNLFDQMAPGGRPNG